ncbi:E3 ubiquitin-protein ligase TRIM58-like [Mantella aurantiaca]
MASPPNLRRDLTCSICLDVYKDPATLRCGHSFCLVCIYRLLRKQDLSRIYTCPQCRKRFWSRPAPNKNITLHTIAERFHTSRLDQDRNAIFCTYCDFSVLAVRSCQQCETSMCATHLRKHNEKVEHILLPPTAELWKRRCPVHGKIMEYFCTEDSVCICATCRLDGEHIGHQTESVEEASEKKLRPLLEKVTLEREKTEQQIQSLKERRARAQQVVARMTTKLGDVRNQLEALENIVLGEVSRWEMQISQLVSNLTEQLETKNNELSKKMHLFEGLRDLADPLNVLQDQELDKDLHDSKEALPNDPEFPELQEDLISSALHKLLDKLTNAKMWIREPSGILLNLHTAADNLFISDDLKTASRLELKKSCANTPDRPHDCGVLSCSSFSSWQHYWEVDTSQSDSWRVGMCYSSINRKNRVSMIGKDNDSWCLWRRKDNYTMMHDSDHILLPHQPSSHKFRIYLDYQAGQLSFYELGGPMRHLYTFTATFSKPLHAVLVVFQGSITISN